MLNVPCHGDLGWISTDSKSSDQIPKVSFSDQDALCFIKLRGKCGNIMHKFLYQIGQLYIQDGRIYCAEKENLLCKRKIMKH